MDKSIKVSFEIEDNWNLAGFRNFVKYLLSDNKYDVYLISNDDSSADIMRIGTDLGLSNDKIIICNFIQDKVQAIINNNISIHLDNLQSTVMLVDETTDAYGILVTRNMNKYYIKPDYVIVFERLLKLINEEEGIC